MTNPISVDFDAAELVSQIADELRSYGFVDKDLDLDDYVKHNKLDGVLTEMLDTMPSDPTNRCTVGRALTRAVYRIVDMRHADPQSSYNDGDDGHEPLDMRLANIEHALDQHSQTLGELHTAAHAPQTPVADVLNSIADRLVRLELAELANAAPRTTGELLDAARAEMDVQLGQAGPDGEPDVDPDELPQLVDPLARFYINDGHRTVMVVEIVERGGMFGVEQFDTANPDGRTRCGTHDNGDDAMRQGLRLCGWGIAE